MWLFPHGFQPVGWWVECVNLSIRRRVEMPFTLAQANVLEVQQLKSPSTFVRGARHGQGRLEGRQLRGWSPAGLFNQPCNSAGDHQDQRKRTSFFRLTFNRPTYFLQAVAALKASTLCRVQSKGRAALYGWLWFGCSTTQPWCPGQGGVCVCVSYPENAHKDLGASTATARSSVLRMAESIWQKSIHQ